MVGSESKFLIIEQYLRLRLAIFYKKIFFGSESICLYISVYLHIIFQKCMTFQLNSKPISIVASMSAKSSGVPLELRETSYKNLKNTMLQPVLCIYCQKWYDKSDFTQWEGAKFISPVAGICPQHGNASITYNEYSKQLSNEAKLIIHQIILFHSHTHTIINNNHQL